MIRNLSKTEIEKILSSHYVGRMGCCDNNIPHVIPITYYYDKKTKSIISHTREGMKSKIFRNNPSVCLEVEEFKNLCNWKSVVVYGKVEELTGVTARNALHIFVENLKKIIRKVDNMLVSKVSDISHSTHPNNNAIIYRIKPTKISGKFEQEQEALMRA